MQAFLLAAGKGSRISKNIPEIPKCTLPVGDRPLIQRTVEMLLSNNIQVTIIVGYKHKYIREVLKTYDINIVYNPFYDVTNSIASLWLARNFIQYEDTIIANADVYWNQEILDSLIEHKDDVFLLTDKTRVLDGDYFFYAPNGCVEKYGKELEIEERTCEYVGIARVCKNFVSSFKNRLEALIEKQNHGLWWENVLYSFSDEREISILDVEGKFWAEIDFIEDYERILEYVRIQEKINDIE